MKRERASQRGATLRCSHRDLNRAVLARQHLIQRLPTGIEVGAAIAAIGPLQAQYSPSPFLALLARVEGFTAGEFRAALDSYRVVKASLMRGTLHVVGAAEYRMYASTVDGPVTRLWTTWLGKLLDVEPMQAAARPDRPGSPQSQGGPRFLRGLDGSALPGRCGVAARGQLVLRQVLSLVAAHPRRPLSWTVTSMTGI